MKPKPLLLTLLSLLSFSLIKAQSTYRSLGTGVTVDLGAAANWQTSPDGGTSWVTAAAAPTGLATGSTILIQTGDTWANTAATTTIPAGVTLTNNSTLLGAFTAGKLTCAGTLVYSGTAAQTLPASTSFVSSTIANLTINNAAGVSPNGTFSITGVLNLLSGQFNCNTGGVSFNYKGSITGNGPLLNVAGNFFSQGAAGQVIPGTLLLNNTINKLNVSTSTAGLVNYSSTGPIKISAGIGLYAGVFTLGGTLTVTGATITAAAGAGGITAGSNMVTFNATSAQTIPTGFFTGNAVNNLTLSNALGVSSAGAISIGNSLTVTGLGAVTPLTVTGTATINGDLTIGSFSTAPTVGQQYTLVSATAISGTFGGNLTLPAGYVGSLSYTATSVILTVNPSTNANLASLVLSAGTLNPAFDSGTANYTASVPNSTSTIKVTPTAAEGGSTIKVNNSTVASGAASSAINLAVGNTTITTIVTAHDGSTTQTYKVVVTRAPLIYYSNSSGDLSSLSTYGTSTDGTGTAPADFATSGATYQLANRSSYALTNDLTLGSTLNIPAASTLDLGGKTLTLATLSGTGTLSGSNTSSLVVNGTISGLSFATGKEQLSTLTLGSGANLTLSSALAIASTGTINIGANATLNTNNTLTLRSDASGTAQIAALGSGASITGNATVERYLADKRGWRLITSSVSSSQSINTAWQEGAGGTTNNPNPGYGTFVVGGSTANGFDAVGTSGSLLVYNGTAFNSVANTNATTISANTAYFLFSIGNRALNPATAGVHSSTILRSTGSVLTGTQTTNVTAAGYTLFGNPYAAPVDFSKLTRSATVPDRFYAWDINLGTYGGYVLVSNSGGTYTSVPSSPSGLNNIIASGAAIFVQSDGSTAATLTADETSKATGAGTNTFANFSTYAATNNQHNFRVNLTDANSQLIDGVMANYAAINSNKVDGNDAPKLNNFYENISLIRSGIQLTLERRSELTAKDTLFVQLSGVQTATYQLQINPADFNQSGVTAYLEDAYLHTRTKVDLTQTSNVSFNTNADTTSYKNRFQITFTPDGANTVATKISHIGAGVTAYPNPAIAKQVNLSFDGMPAGNYNITVTNTFGQVMQKNSMIYTGSSTSTQLKTDYSTGVYTVNIQSAGYNQSIKVIIP